MLPEKRVPLPFLQRGAVSRPNLPSRQKAESRTTAISQRTGRREVLLGTQLTRSPAELHGKRPKARAAFRGPLLETAGSSGTFPAAQDPPTPRRAACQLLHAHPVPARGLPRTASPSGLHSNHSENAPAFLTSKIPHLGPVFFRGTSTSVCLRGKRWPCSLTMTKGGSVPTQQLPEACCRKPAAGSAARPVPCPFPALLSFLPRLPHAFQASDCGLVPRATLLQGNPAAVRQRWGFAPGGGGGTPEKQEEHPTFMWPRLGPGEPRGALHCPPCPVTGAAGDLVGESLSRSSRTGRASGLQSAPARALLNADCTRGPFHAWGWG